MNFKKEQIISLSHPLYNNGQEHFPYAVECKGRMNKDWYIECVCTLGSHCGTHVEVPYHHDQFGQDVKDFPIENLIGECVVLNVEGKQPGEAIRLPSGVQDSAIAPVSSRSSRRAASCGSSPI